MAGRLILKLLLSKLYSKRTLFFHEKEFTLNLRNILTVILVLVAVNTSVFAANNQQEKASDHAPIGVMREHVHGKGEWMTSYRYMRMEMAGLQSQTSEVSQEDAINDSRFNVSPRFMLMDKHVFGAMYGFSDKVTGAIMLPFISQSMSHNHTSTVVNHFRRGFQGFGDAQVSAIYQSAKTDTYEILLDGGVSLPLGTIAADDKGHLPYPMQLGSGTVDMLPGVTVKGKLPNPNQTWGSQLSAILRSGYNDQGYRLGNQYKATAWLANDYTPNLSGSFRLTYISQDSIIGEDDDIPTIVSPAQDPSLQGGQRADFSVGVNYIIPKGFLQGHRIAAEAGLPVYQYLNGPQLQTDYWYTVGWQLAF